MTNGVSDPSMSDEKGKAPDSHPVLGRFHGFSATGITLAEFTKIIQSLHPMGNDNSPMARPTPATNAQITEKHSGGTAPAPLKIHPKVFNMIICWVSDSESPVATEINLNAVEKNGNQFNEEGLKQEGDWLGYFAPHNSGCTLYT